MPHTRPRLCADGVGQQVGGCVTEYAVASCAERPRFAEHCGSLPYHSATVFRRGGGYEASALEGAIPSDPRSWITCLIIQSTACSERVNTSSAGRYTSLMTLK